MTAMKGFCQICHGTTCVRACADCHLLYVVWFSVSVRIDLHASGEAEVTLIGVRWGEGIAESWHSISWEKRTPNKEEYVKDRRRRRGDMTVIKRRERTAECLLREAIVWRRRPRSCSYITCLTFRQPHPHPSTHPFSLRFFCGSRSQSNFCLSSCAPLLRKPRPRWNPAVLLWPDRKDWSSGPCVVFFSSQLRCQNGSCLRASIRVHSGHFISVTKSGLIYSISPYTDLFQWHWGKRVIP